MSTRRLILLSIFLALGSEALAQICSTEPSEARKLLVSSSAAVRLSWLAPTDTGGSPTILYDVLRSMSPSGFSGAQCLASGIPTLFYDDIGFTGTGYYLVRSRNACGGNLGAASTGTPRTGPSCPQSDGGQCFTDFDCLTTACCDGFCRDLDTNVVHCGACGMACPAANGVPHCVNGVCGLASCNPGFENCDSDAGNGCEAHLETDPYNCGTCGVACPSAPHADATCSASACSLSCHPGFENCDSDAGNGCEAHLDTDPYNCGTCGVACPSAPNTEATCFAGTCITSCNPGFENCDSDPGNGCEANLGTDPYNCGACGLACPNAPNAAATCVASTCSLSCNPGFSNCDGSPENGCECAGNVCCDGACPPPHLNGLGQSFVSCAPLGVPGNPTTYSLPLAQAARAAWPVPGNDSAGICGVGPSAGSAVIRQTATSCAVWVYEKTMAGYVHLNDAGTACICPTIGDPTWM